MSRCISKCPLASWFIKSCNRKESSSNSSAKHNSDSSSESSSYIRRQRTSQSESNKDVLIGTGSFGTVWRRTWEGQVVAVKVFSDKHEQSWFEEKQIFLELRAVKNQHLLRFVDAISFGNQYYLITEFHEKGSLFQYLIKNAIDHAALLKMITSILSGIECLHSRISGPMGKAAIAHRDIKGLNILVKSNGECAIADFGAAVCLSSGCEDLITCAKSGTKRYTAPELLDRSRKMPESTFLMADMYSFGLVLWEACRRCETHGTFRRSVEPFATAYFDVLPVRPDWEHMQKLLWEQKLRPVLPKTWKNDRILSSLGVLMSECWHQDPERRPTASRAKIIVMSLSLYVPGNRATVSETS